MPCFLPDHDARRSFDEHRCLFAAGALPSGDKNLPIGRVRESWPAEDRATGGGTGGVDDEDLFWNHRCRTA